MRKTLTYPLLLKAAAAIIAIADSYKSSGAPKTERALDPALYVFLLGAGTHVERQVSVRVAKKKQRIDFRCKGTNPANLEWALRPAANGGQLSARSNETEIKKLSRTSNARRYLLLIDLTRDSLAMQKETLAEEYASSRLGQGRYPRHSVTVVYVHRACRFKFIWRP